MADDVSRDRPDSTTKPTDVALFMPTLVGGGAERVQLVLADYFRAQGLRVDVVVCKRFGALRDSVPEGVRLVDLGTRRVLLSLRAYERYLHSARPRVVISSVENASVIACLARARGKHPHRLIVRQDNALIATESVWREPRRWPWLLALAFTFRHADRLIAVSQGVEDELRRLLGRSGPTIQCLYNPIITADYEAQLSMEPVLPWPDHDVPLIVSAGRLQPVKDHPTLLRAFALLRRRMAARLLIMGEGESRPALELLASELGITADIHFAGFVGNPLPIFRRADVYVLSSIVEGLPTVLIEALAAGTQIVSTDCRHGPREILRDGRYGRLVPIGDADALAAAIIETLTTPRSYPSSELRDYLTQYTVDHAGRFYRDLLDDSVDAAPSAPAKELSAADMGAT